MRRTALFVLSDVRSGTTLLDQCLGANDQITSLGEVHWIRAYVRRDRNIYNPVHPLDCSCGLPVSACPFWLEIQRVLGRPLDSLRLHSTLAKSHDMHGMHRQLKFLPRRIVRRRPSLYRYSGVRWFLGGAQLARDCIALYDAVAKVSGQPYCVDSSKSVFRFRAVYEMDRKRTRAIVMARDYRAVVYSKMQRGESMETAAAGWNRAMSQIEVLTRGLPASAVLKLTYEALCQDPSRELRRICDFIGVEFTEQMLVRPTRNTHHIGGSPSKFDAGRTEIRLDRSYEKAFSATELAEIRKLVSPSAEHWSY